MEYYTRRVGTLGRFHGNSPHLGLSLRSFGKKGAVQTPPVHLSELASNMDMVRRVLLT